MKITVVGAGYVGVSLAVLLAQKNQVTIVDVSMEKVNLINQGQSPVEDSEIEHYLSYRKLNLTATLDAEPAYAGADYIVVAVPTDYDSDCGCFDTSKVESVVDKIFQVNPQVNVIIKSTVPVGFTQRLAEAHKCRNLLFSPEFLRESKALYDNLYPSRIITGYLKQYPEMENTAKQFVALLQEASLRPEAPVLIMDATEAEAVKLFANTYLALRVGYFNELDTYAEMKGLDVRKIIEGVCSDPRIGDYYNNPSFGYGGYCLPKDTRQLLAGYKDIPENLMGAIVESNNTRKDFIADQILKRAGYGASNQHQEEGKDFVIGVFRLAMKRGSDNFRQSSVLDVIKRLKTKAIKLLIYEPMLGNELLFDGNEVINDLERFKRISDYIIANRYDDCLNDVKEKVYTRDLYERD